MNISNAKIALVHDWYLKKSIGGGNRCAPSLNCKNCDDGKNCQYKTMFSSTKKDGLCLDEKCISKDKYNKSKKVIERLEVERIISTKRNKVIDYFSRLDRLIKQKGWYSMVIMSYFKEVDLMSVR